MFLVSAHVSSLDGRDLRTRLQTKHTHTSVNKYYHGKMFLKCVLCRNVLCRYEISSV